MTAEHPPPPETDSTPPDRASAPPEPPKPFYTAIPELENDAQTSCGHRHGSIASAWACAVAQMDRGETGLWKPVRVADGKIHEKHYLNEYLTKRRWGGPEEGGWWYETRRLVTEHGEFETGKEAEAAKEALSAYVDEQRLHQHPPHSVLCRGRTELIVEPHPGIDYPLKTPRYS